LPVSFVNYWICSVDANVLYLERIKEEIGQKVKKEQAVGLTDLEMLFFILDANITTGFNCGYIFILAQTYLKRHSQLTLLLSIINLSFYRYIHYTSIVDWYVVVKGKEALDFSTGLTKNLSKNGYIDFLD